MQRSINCTKSDMFKIFYFNFQIFKKKKKTNGNNKNLLTFLQRPTLIIIYNKQTTKPRIWSLGQFLRRGWVDRFSGGWGS